MFCLNQISQRLNSQNSHRNAVFVVIFVAIFFLYFASVLLYVPGARTFGFFGDKADLVLVAEGRSNFSSQPILWAWVFVVVKFLNPFATYNFIVLMSFPLGCYFGYRFLRRFYDPGIAFVLSLVFAFSPYSIYKIYNHSALAQTWLFPFFLLALLDFDGAASFCNLMKLAGALAVVALLSNYYGGFALLIVGLFFLIRVVQHYLAGVVYLTRRRLGYLALALVLGVGVVLPFIFSYFKIVYLGASGPHYSRSAGEFVTFSTRPWYFLLPPIDHPIFGQLSRAVYNLPNFWGQDFFWEEHGGAYWGWVNFLLGVYAIYHLFRRRRQKRDIGYGATFFWLFLALIVFSSPPLVEIFGFRLALPSYLLMRVFPTFRVLARLAPAIFLCLLVLVGQSLSRLKERLAINRLRYLLLLGAYLGITFFEFYFPPEVRETPPRNSIEYEFFLNKAADVKEVNIFYK